MGGKPKLFQFVSSGQGVPWHNKARAFQPEVSNLWRPRTHPTGTFLVANVIFLNLTDAIASNRQVPTNSLFHTTWATYWLWSTKTVELVNTVLSRISPDEASLLVHSLFVGRSTQPNKLLTNLCVCGCPSPNTTLWLLFIASRYSNSSSSSLPCLWNDPPTLLMKTRVSEWSPPSICRLFSNVSCLPWLSNKKPMSLMETSVLGWPLPGILKRFSNASQFNASVSHLACPDPETRNLSCWLVVKCVWLVVNQYPLA